MQNIHFQQNKIRKIRVQKEKERIKRKISNRRKKKIRTYQQTTHSLSFSQITQQPQHLMRIRRKRNIISQKMRAEQIESTPQLRHSNGKR